MALQGRASSWLSIASGQPRKCLQVTLHRLSRCVYILIYQQLREQEWIYRRGSGRWERRWEITELQFKKKKQGLEKKNQPFYYVEVSDLWVLFQTNPTYLAKLIFQMPQNKSTKFMDSVIFTLYNYASNQREEYLLLRLFKTALQEEIKYAEGAGGPAPGCCSGLRLRPGFAFPWSQLVRNNLFRSIHFKTS